MGGAGGTDTHTVLATAAHPPPSCSSVSPYHASSRRGQGGGGATRHRCQDVVLQGRSGAVVVVEGPQHAVGIVGEFYDGQFCEMAMGHSPLLLQGYTEKTAAIEAAHGHCDARAVSEHAG